MNGFSLWCHGQGCVPVNLGGTQECVLLARSPKIHPNGTLTPMYPKMCSEYICAWVCIFRIFFFPVRICFPVSVSPAIYVCTKYVLKYVQPHVPFTDLGMQQYTPMCALIDLSAIRSERHLISKGFVKIVIGCIIGSVVECVIAIHATRVRFTDDAFLFLSFLFFYVSTYVPTDAVLAPHVQTQVPEGYVLIA